MNRKRQLSSDENEFPSEQAALPKKAKLSEPHSLTEKPDKPKQVKRNRHSATGSRRKRVAPPKVDGHKDGRKSSNRHGAVALVSRPLPSFEFMVQNPVDVALLVFQFLGPRDLCTASQVCPSWRSALKDDPRYHDARAVLERLSKFTNLQKREKHFQVDTYEKKQPDFNSSMRGILLDWLAQVNAEFDNGPETLFLTARMLDRFLFHTENKVQRGGVQLVGVVCLLLASKIEETHYPDLDELVYLCDNIYARDAILKCERYVMVTLSHSLHSPTVHYFLTFLMTEAKSVEPVKQQCLYLAHQSLLEMELVHMSPSLVATTIFCYVHYANGLPYLPALDLAAYTPSEMLECASLLYSVAREAPLSKLQHIRARFLTPNTSNAAGTLRLDHSFISLLKGSLVASQVRSIHDPTYIAELMSKHPGLFEPVECKVSARALFQSQKENSVLCFSDFSESSSSSSETSSSSLEEMEPDTDDELDTFDTQIDTQMDMTEEMHMGMEGEMYDFSCLIPPPELWAKAKEKDDERERERATSQAVIVSILVPGAEPETQVEPLAQVVEPLAQVEPLP